MTAAACLCAHCVRCCCICCNHFLSTSACAPTSVLGTRAASHSCQPPTTNPGTRSSPWTDSPELEPSPLTARCNRRTHIRPSLPFSLPLLDAHSTSCHDRLNRADFSSLERPADRKIPTQLLIERPRSRICDFASAADTALIPLQCRPR